MPYGSRSAPVVFGDHLYLQTSSGAGATLQERVMCFNADTGKLLWEHKYNLFTSDVPPHRIAWAAPAVDPATGNVFAFSGNGLLMSLSKDGKLLWERSLAEEFGMWTTHGGRVSSPIVDGSAGHRERPDVQLGTARAAARTASCRSTRPPAASNWVSSPEGRPTDTIYANPFVADVNGTRTFFSGGSDGAMHALKVATGQPIWNWRRQPARPEHGGAGHRVRRDRHPQRREPRVERDGHAGRDAGRQDRHAGRQGRAVAAARRAGGIRIAGHRRRADLHGRQRRRPPRVRRESRKAAVVREASARFRSPRRCSPTASCTSAPRIRECRRQVLHHPAARRPGGDSRPGLARHGRTLRVIIASPAVARGRIYLASMDALYAIGPKGTPKKATSAAKPPATSGTNGPSVGPAATLLVTPTELILKPGESVALTARAFDAQGHELPNPGQATWTLENLKGTVANGRFTRRRGGSGAGGTGEGEHRRAVGHGARARRPRLPVDLRLRGWARGAAAALGQRDRTSSRFAIWKAARSS